MKQELKGLEETGKTAVDNPIKLHYNMMKKRADKMAKNCANFFFMITDIRTDLRAIPTDDCDHTYVDEWVEENMKKSSLAFKLLTKHKK